MVEGSQAPGAAWPLPSLPPSRTVTVTYSMTNSKPYAHERDSRQKTPNSMMEEFDVRAGKRTCNTTGSAEECDDQSDLCTRSFCSSPLRNHHAKSLLGTWARSLYQTSGMISAKVFWSRSLTKMSVQAVSWQDLCARSLCRDPLARSLWQISSARSLRKSLPELSWQDLWTRSL